MPKLTLVTFTALSFLALSFCLGCGSTRPIVCEAPASAASSPATCSCGGGNCPAQYYADVYAIGDNGEISAFPVETGFSLGTPITTPGPASSVGMVQLGDDLLFVSDPQAQGGGTIDGWTINVQTGALTAVASSPYVLGPSAKPNGLALAQGDEPIGEFLYAADAGTIDALQLNIGTGGAWTLVPGSPFLSGTNVYLTVDPTSRFVFAADQDAPGGVFAFTIDASTGALTTVPGSPFLIGSNAAPVQTGQIVVDPSGSFVYVTLPAAGQVAGFSINASSGVLTPISGSPFAAGNGSFAIAVNNAPGPGPFNMYVANETADSISGYNINATTGALTPVVSSPFAAAGVTAMVTDTLGHLYAYGSGGMMAYDINFNSGELTAIGSPVTFSGATVLAFVGP
jgi:6-phosphogluconolactonase (cycloisomerase 2 family)